MEFSYLKYILALLLFGSNGIVASYILLNSYEIVYLRTMLGSLFLLCIFILMKQKFTLHHYPKDLIYLIIAGIAMGASWILLFEAYTKTGVSIATLLYYIGPVIVMVLSPLLFRETLSRAKVAGFIAVMLGMLLVNGQALKNGSVSIGVLFGLLAAVMYAIMVIFNKKASHITGLENATSQLIISFLTVSIYVVMKQGFFIELSNVNLFAIFMLGFINTGLGCYFYFSSIGTLPVQSVSILGYLEPLSALIFSIVFLHEYLTGWQIIGACLILGGAAYGELRKSTSSGNVT